MTDSSTQDDCEPTKIDEAYEKYNSTEAIRLLVCDGGGLRAPTLDERVRDAFIAGAIAQILILTHNQHKNNDTN